MSKFSRNVSFEKRRVRWNNAGKTTMVFFATLFTILIFILIIGSFTWIMGLIMAMA